MQRSPQERDSLAAIRRDLGRYARLLIGIVAILWVIEIVNLGVFQGSLIRWGVIPRTTQGLPGILLHPLLHGGIAHLATNSLGFLMLGGLVVVREVRDFWLATLLGTVIGGAGTWAIGRPGPHVGLSGVIFAYLGYLLTTGWFDRRVGSIIISVFALLCWGTALFGLLPTQSGISWEGHLFGFLGGVLTAALRPKMRRAQAAA